LGIRESIVLLIATFMKHIVKANAIKESCDKEIWHKEIHNFLFKDSPAITYDNASCFIIFKRFCHSFQN